MKKSKTSKLNAKKIATLGLITGTALIAFLLENLISPGIPGVKLGFSNVFTLFTLVLYGLPEALLVVTARTVLGSLFAGNPSLLLYSLTAGASSAVLSRLLLSLCPKISLLCVSVTAAVFHNFVQLTVYCLLTQTALLFVYSPVLAISGVIAGLAVGLTVAFTVKILPLSFFTNTVCPSRREKARSQS